MLATITFDPFWRWATVGKHPVVKDYFSLGHHSPFADGFSTWIENGYRIRTEITALESISIDTPDDLLKIKTAS